MAIIVRYDEIGLKGKNRDDFEKLLVKNIKKIIDADIMRTRGRMVVDTNEKPDLSKVFGISSYSYAVVTADIESEVKSLAKNIGKDKTFRISVQRVDKSYPIKSIDLERQLGQIVVDMTAAKVDLKNPDKTIHVEIISGKNYVFDNKNQGYGGLPVGSSGNVVSLMSSGIDSPVASWMMAKRGCRVIFLFNKPYGEKEDNAIKLFRKLQEYIPDSRLYIVDYGKMHEEIRSRIKSKLRCVVCKRYMYKIANEIAKIEGAKAIITGESVGQVASQTIDNLYCLDKAAIFPVLRPVIGMNKQEIINIAKKIGTFDISIQKNVKCWLLPDNPATRSKIEEIEKEELRLDEKIIKEIIDSAKIVS